MSILTVNGVTKYYGAEFVFGDIDFQVARGDKIALVGANGAGKTTLLKIIAGIEQPTSGSVHLARGRRVAYLAQEARFSGDRTLWKEMEAAFEYLNALRREMTELEQILADTNAPDWEQQMERYGELEHRFAHGGGYEIEHRIERTLHGLGFVEEQYHQPLAQFSGGQKTRAALAAVLLSDPDLLLLDEPTNHLDLAAIEWLERFLQDWDNVLILISHDRYFLDKVTTRTMEIAFGRLEDYPAPYSKYLDLKAERLDLQLKQYQAQQEYIAKTEEYIRRFKNSQLSRQARGRERRLERLKEGWESGAGRSEQLVERVQQQKKLAFSIDTQLRSGDLVLKLDKLVVGYRQPNEADASPGEQVVLIRCPDLEIQRGQRVALMGPNGAGKTTLLRTIVGELPALHGYVRLGHKVALNYYAQAHEGLQLDATVLDEIRRIAPLIKETQARTLLGRFLFSGDDVFKRVGDLSGGERSRVALAQLTLMSGNLMVLDEPTNHLDISSREALEVVLNEYNGSLLFVSHDRSFIDAVADTLWIVQNGGIEVFQGTYSEYVAFREARNAQSLRAKSEEAKSPKPAGQKNTQPTGRSTTEALSTDGNRDRSDKEERKRQRRLVRLEEEISMLEAELKQIEAEMSEAGLRGEIDRITALGYQHTEIQQMLSTRYDEWAATAG